jgi:hypothetical protein
MTRASSINTDPAARAAPAGVAAAAAAAAAAPPAKARAGGDKGSAGAAEAPPPGLIDLSLQAVGAAFYIVDAHRGSGSGSGGAGSGATSVNWPSHMTHSASMPASHMGLAAAAGSIAPPPAPGAPSAGGRVGPAHARSTSMGMVSVAGSEASGAGGSGGVGGSGGPELLRMLALYADLGLEYTMTVR